MNRYMKKMAALLAAMMFSLSLFGCEALDTTLRSKCLWSLTFKAAMRERIRILAAPRLLTSSIFNTV